MLSVRGIYENGQVRLLESVQHPKPAKAIVTILEEAEPEHQEKKLGSKRDETETAEDDIRLSAVTDTSEDFLSEEELDYYLNLEELP